MTRNDSNDLIQGTHIAGLYRSFHKNRRAGLQPMELLTLRSSYSARLLCLQLPQREWAFIKQAAHESLHGHAGIHKYSLQKVPN